MDAKAIASVRLCTLLLPEEWAEVTKGEQNFITGSNDYSPEDIENGHARGDAFMKAAMKRHRGGDFSGDIPVWAWPEVPEWAMEHNSPPGVLVWFTVPAERVLFFDEAKYEAVLENRYLSRTAAEESACRKLHPTWEEIEASWADIFRTDRCDTAELAHLGPVRLGARVDRVELMEIIKGGSAHFINEVTRKAS